MLRNLIASPRKFERAIRDSDMRLALPQFGDFESWRDIRAKNRNYLMPFEPSWKKDALSEAAFKRFVRRAHREFQARKSATLLIMPQTDTQVMGGLSLTNIRYGVAEMGSLGYWMAEEFARAGRMKLAVAEILRLAFEHFELHRIEAACLPENKASAAVLLAAGFEEEGFAKSYLRINGDWRDHRLFACVKT